MRSLKSETRTNFLLLGFMLSFALFGSFALLLNNYYLLCVPFGALLLLTSIGGIEVLFFFLLFLIPLSVEQKITTTLSTDFPDELLMWLITGVAWVAILYSKKLCSRLFTICHPVWVLVAMSVFWVFLTMVFSSHPLISLKYFLSKIWYVTCFFILPIFIFSKPEHIKRIFQVVLFAMLIVVAYAFVKQVSIDFSFLRVNEAVRPFFRNHVNYSALLACIIPLLIISIFYTKSFKLKILLVVALTFCIINIVFAYSRGAWLGLICCPIFYFILKRKIVKPFLISSFAVLGVAVFLLISTGMYNNLKPTKKDTIYHTDIQYHLKATYELTDMSFAERFYRWIAGVKMTKSKPVFGFGPNTFYLNYKAHTNADFETWVSANYEKSSIHNYYLLQFAEQGLIGGCIFLALIYFAFTKLEVLYHANKKVSHYALGIGFVMVVICVELFVNDLIETDKIGSVFYLALAGVVILEKSTVIEKGTFL